ncbi:MAG: hypothetical protein Q4B87_03315, partial [Candidatus Saccharibacteria bacterium]|nr:hypothetical protein [Candidatus Saccharibacteria bacterium]
AVTITGKTTEYAITLVKTNATAIVIDGTSYTGSSATLTYGTHTISGTYPSGYEFSSWSTSNSTNLAITSTSSASTTITVHGAAMLTLNGKSSCTAISGYMQDASASSAYCDGSTGSMTDRRDSQVYTVAKINGNLWMTRNLAIGCNGSGSSYGSSVSRKSLTNTYSNVSSSFSTPTASLDKNDGTSGCTTSDDSDCNSYDTPRMKCSSTYGAWYNYAAASAGTITGTSNETADTYNICPKGWTLPTYDQQSGITSYSSAFSPVTGGSYTEGANNFTWQGCWWSATANYGGNRYRLSWNGSSLDTGGSYILNRRFGFYVRCIRK